MVSFTFLSGPITNTDLTVNLSLTCGWIMSYKFDTLKSGSAMIGKLTCVFCVSLISPIHCECDATVSVLNATTFTLRLSNSARSFDTAPSSVVQYQNCALNLIRSEEHTSELQSHSDLVCRLLLDQQNSHLVIR